MANQHKSNQIIKSLWLGDSNFHIPSVPMLYLLFLDLCSKFSDWERIMNLTNSHCDPSVFNQDFQLGSIDLFYQTRHKSLSLVDLWCHFITDGYLFVLQEIIWFYFIIILFRCPLPMFCGRNLFWRSRSTISWHLDKRKWIKLENTSIKIESKEY